MRTSVYLGGYTLDAKGIRMWPLRKYAGAWCDLIDVELGRTDGQHAQHHLVLRFSTRAKPVKVAIGGGAENLRRLACVLQWIKEANPRVEAWQLSFFDEFMATVHRVPDESRPTAQLTDDDRLALARFWWLALQPRCALRECARLIRDRSPLEVDAALLAIDARVTEGNWDDAVAMFEDVLSRHPEQPRLLARGAALLLDFDDGRGESLAERVVSGDLSEAPKIGLHWAWYHFRARRWSEALAVLDRVEGRAHPLSQEFAAEFARARDEIAACRMNPTRGLRQTVGRRWLAVSLQVGLPALVLALMAWPLIGLGPIFYREGRDLAVLESRGVRVDAASVRELKRHDVRDSDLAELHYVFAPDIATAEPWEVPDLRSLDRTTFSAYIDRITAGRLPGGWHRGAALLYDTTAKAIERDASLRFVTYLQEDPSVNTIGPITPTRIWFTWLAAGKGAFMAVVAAGIMVCLTALLIRDMLKRRSRRRNIL